MNPAEMPKHKPCRYVQGRHTELVRRWADGKWKTETTGVPNGK